MEVDWAPYFLAAGFGVFSSSELLSKLLTESESARGMMVFFSGDLDKPWVKVAPICSWLWLCIGATLFVNVEFMMSCLACANSVSSSGSIVRNFCISLLVVPNLSLGRAFLGLTKRLRPIVCIRLGGWRDEIISRLALFFCLFFVNIWKASSSSS